MAQWVHFVYVIINRVLFFEVRVVSTRSGVIDMSDIGRGPIASSPQLVMIGIRHSFEPELIQYPILLPKQYFIFLGENNGNRI
jgi:hypothetical protein